MSIFKPTPMIDRARPCHLPGALPSQRGQPPEGQPPFSAFGMLTIWRKGFPGLHTSCPPGIPTLCAGARVEPAFKPAMTRHLPTNSRFETRSPAKNPDSGASKRNSRRRRRGWRHSRPRWLRRVTRPRSRCRQNPFFSASSTVVEKVALFRSRFRGVRISTPRFWTNARTGRKGYAPACRNEWVRGG